MANANVRLGYKDAAWFTANASLILKEGQIVNLLQTGKYKLGDGVTQLSVLSFLGSKDYKRLDFTISGLTITLPDTPTLTHWLALDGQILLTNRYSIVTNTITMDADYSGQNLSIFYEY